MFLFGLKNPWEKVPTLRGRLLAEAQKEKEELLVGEKKI